MQKRAHLVLCSMCIALLVGCSAGSGRAQRDGGTGADSGRTGTDGGTPDSSGAYDSARPSGPGFVIDHSNGDPDAIPSEHLDAVRRLDIFWGRQSVGGNILQGLDRLSSTDRTRYGLQIQYINEGQSTIFDGRDLVGVVEIGSNGDPLSKTEAFSRDMGERGFGAHVDVAMMKFCFVDFGEDLPAPGATFEDYCATMEALESAHPSVRFVWWTAPIMTTGSAERDAFNQSVREYATAHGKTLFDLADLESHDPSGTAVRDGGYEAMYPAYSADGGHLRETGQAHVARAWWVLLARIAGWGG